MIFPEFIKAGDRIAVTAPSAGITDDIRKARFDSGRNKLESRGYGIVYGDTVFSGIDRLRSAEKRQRAEELMIFFKDESIKYIASARGGDMLMEILPYIDYELIKNNPKWFQGYSDNTGLTFSITTIAGVASVYGSNFGDYGMDEWHRAVSENIEIIEGKRSVQESFEYYEEDFHDYVTGFEGYYNDRRVKWVSYEGYNKTDEVHMKGRLIGGCLDVIMDLVGTRFEDFLGFKKRYMDDGIILYFESFIANTESVMRALWKLKQLGWFDGIEGIVFGRPMFLSGDAGMTYEEAVIDQIGEMGLKLIFDADIGHKAPRLTIINGAMAKITCRTSACGEAANGRIEYAFV